MQPRAVCAPRAAAAALQSPVEARGPSRRVSERAREPPMNRAAKCEHTADTHDHPNCLLQPASLLLSLRSSERPPIQPRLVGSNCAVAATNQRLTVLLPPRQHTSKEQSTMPLPSLLPCVSPCSLTSRLSPRDPIWETTKADNCGGRAKHTDPTTGHLRDCFRLLSSPCSLLLP